MTRKTVKITETNSTTPPASVQVAATDSVAVTHERTTAPVPISPKFALQVASLCCVLLFVYTMLRICSTLEQMQLLTRETLLQQRQQQELFKEVMQAFLERERNGVGR